MPAAEGSAPARPDPALTDPATAARERRRLERLEAGRREILDVAERLFVEHGYEGTSLEQIAAGCGYSVGSIYNFFTNKDALYSAALERHATSLGTSFRASAEPAAPGIEKVVAMARAAVHDLRGSPRNARLTATSMGVDLAGNADRTSFRAVLEAYAEAIADGQRDGTVRAGNPRHLAQFVGGLVLAQAQVDPEITADPDGITLDDFLDIVRGALSA
ncbi:TetR/AcrR family transcriptional regulator [Blastococcus sp. URHD0036]|uniref:TetR/AcrR family transcriptional regulator n=1 Tax=Blastococcus sp. URHD0036 TaxID=1380356 RepID=UPI00049830F0|nr:TetR/AcrR family transcriptional regulator [Blastococcus sp. URHD0036]